MEMTADISEDGQYRYSLTRRWAPGQLLPFVMLNPSTADAMKDDPTIRRCMGFARRAECAGIWVVNLFAYRATDPLELLTPMDPVGPRNDQAMAEALASSGIAVCGWGAWKLFNMKVERLAAVQLLARVAGTRLHCLGKTKDGNPRHPLYLKADTPLEPWP